MKSDSNFNFKGVNTAMYLAVLLIKGFKKINRTDSVVSLLNAE